VPVPEANDLASLNEQLLAGCIASRDTDQSAEEEK